MAATSHTRRELLAAAFAAYCAPLALLAQPELQQPGWQGIVRQRDEGDLLVTGRRRARMRVKVDSVRDAKVAMSMVVSEVLPGLSIPVHRHRNEDELIFIHTGAGLLTLGERKVPVSAGAMLYGPRNVWHGIENTGSETITWCAIYSPAGFEQYFREAGVTPGQEANMPTPERLSALAEKYGMEFRDA